MQLINIIIALIVAIGFWKSSTKDIERKTAHASKTKCILFLVLTVGVAYFYYKSYQVATFRNYISVKGYKGCYDIKVDSFEHKGEKFTLEHNYCHDSINALVIMHSFSDNETNYNDPISEVMYGDVKSGFRTYCSFANGKDVETKLFPHGDTLDILKNQNNIKHCYDIFFYSNTIPSILPFKVYEEDYSEGSSSDLLGDNRFAFNSSRGVINYKDLRVGYDYDKFLMTRYITHYNGDDSKYIKLQSLNYSKTINTLNFFSAADLTQCNIEVSIDSDMPMGQLAMYFDIPIVVPSLDIVGNKVTSRTFVVHDFNRKYGKVVDFKHFHINFPTLSNLQLIRSLILTTLLTALLSLSATSCFFYGRKWYKKYKIKKGFSISFKKRIVLLWIPVGEIILWTMMALFTYLLIKSMFNSYININLWAVKLINLLTFIILLLYICLVAVIMYLLYRRGIYWRDIKSIIKCQIKYLPKIPRKIQRCIRYHRLIFIRKMNKKENKNTN